MPGIALSSDSIDNPNKIADIVKEAFDEADIDTDTINVHTGTYHEGWNSNEPCPHCGAEQFVISIVNGEVYALNENQDLVFEAKTDSLGGMVTHHCDECGELIEEVPYEELL